MTTVTLHFKGDPVSKRASDVCHQMRGKYGILQEGKKSRAVLTVAGLLS